MRDSKLHIYGQTSSHDHAFIVGNKEALEQLRDAINDALDDTTGVVNAATTDGEGFELKVFYEYDKEFWDKASLPYTNKNDVIRQEDAISPWDLYRKYKR